jgi:hypothetical protein
MRTLYSGIRIAECGIVSGKYQKLQVDAALDPVGEIEGSGRMCIMQRKQRHMTFIFALR